MEFGVEQLRRMLVSQARRAGLPLDDAEDAASTVIVKLLERELDVRKISHYASRAMSNHLTDLRRMKRQRKTSLMSECVTAVGAEPEPSTKSVLRLVLAGAQHDELLEAITRLPDSQRDVIALVYLEEMSVKEAAKQLKVTPNTVRSRICRARKTLEPLRPALAA